MSEKSEKILYVISKSLKLSHLTNFSKLYPYRQKWTFSCEGTRRRDPRGRTYETQFQATLSPEKRWHNTNGAFNRVPKSNATNEVLIGCWGEKTLKEKFSWTRYQVQRNIIILFTWKLRNYIIINSRIFLCPNHTITIKCIQPAKSWCLYRCIACIKVGESGSTVGLKTTWKNHVNIQGKIIVTIMWKGVHSVFNRVLNMTL